MLPKIENTIAVSFVKKKTWQNFVKLGVMLQLDGRTVLIA
jgi:hypothetical protein